MIVNHQTAQAEKCLSYDVAVVGGGIAGVIAAAAAAKTGAKTILVEASAFLGGVVTSGPLEALMTPQDSQRTVIAGIGQELIEFLQTMDPKATPSLDTTGYCTSIIPYDSETMKYAMMAFLEKRQVAVLTEAIVYDVTMENGCLTALLVANKCCPIRIRCASAVDATGSGRLAFLAGNNIMVGDDQGRSQPVTVLCKIANVDIPLLRSYVASHPQDFKCFREKMDPSLEPLHLWGFTSALKSGYACGELSLLRNEIHMMQTTQDGEVIINYSRMNVDPWDPLALARAQTVCTQQVRQLHAWFQKTIPAFRNSRLIHTGAIGIRESGRVEGRYILTQEDILRAREWEDSVAMGAFPIDIHEAGEGMKFQRVVAGYHIPQRCLMAKDVDNLFTAGRCISSTFEANGSCRISMTCMATGHAAGVMAAVYAIDRNSFDYSTISHILTEQKAVI